MTGSEVDLSVQYAKYGPWVLLATLLVFDIGTALLLRWTLKQIDVGAMVREKGAPVEGAVAGPGDTSYSRVAGVIGSVVIACFFWAFGNVLIYQGFLDASKVATLVGGVWEWLAAGAALFLPYAVNQLRAGLTSK